MKEKIFNLCFCLFLFISLAFILINNQEVAMVIEEALTLFIKRVFPSLFPMFIINDLLIALNIPYYFYLFFNKLFSKIFKVRGIGAYILIMSLISGTPSNAYILKNLENNNLISQEEANHFLYFNYFSNPLFLLNMLSLSFKINIVIKIILTHYISNLIIGLFLRKKAPQSKEITLTKKQEKLTSALTKSINRSISTLLMILGTIVFYMLLTYIITNLASLNILFKTLIAGTLELTNGLNMLANLNCAFKLKEIIATAMISFGAFSIHSQIKGLLEDTDLNYQAYLKGRIWQTIISVGIITLI